MTKDRLLLLFVLALVIGCDRDQPRNQPSQATTVRTRNSPDTTATAPTSRPATSRMTISDREYVFPAARLLLEHAEPTLDILLFSDDARATLASDYKGNRYHLQFRLEITDPSKLFNTDCVIKASTQERLDTPDGIFLEGDRHQLQPHDVHVQFSRLGRDVQVEILGTFIMFGGRDEKAAPVLVPVQGVLVAELEGLRKARPAERP
ncbi:MAG: hypothetical protein ABSH20_16425 [Tepidisphaeraceae bacterium]|jgi:hypothetical protein